VRPILVLTALFCASTAGIVIGYSDMGTLLDPVVLSMLLRAVPVLQAAAALTVGALGALLVAFWLCEGVRNFVCEA
jgi:hypothetical protein